MKMNKTYAVTDLHGMWNLWKQISEYCDETDTIYFLGDAIDRGKDGIKIMMSLLKDRRVKYLLGNHEDFFLTIAPQLVGKNQDDIVATQNDDFYLWLCNGGYDTMRDFIYLPKDEQQWLLKEVEKLDDLEIYVNKSDKCIYLSHAGTDLSYDKYDLMTFGNDNPYLWDRRHFHRPWNHDFDECFIVHGHTPVQYLWKITVCQRPKGAIVNGEIIPQIANYADGHKFDLDLGSFSSHRIALFDLDELKVEKYFEER